jgi:hypothetical protein
MSAAAALDALIDHEDPTPLFDLHEEVRHFHCYEFFFTSFFDFFFFFFFFFFSLLFFSQLAEGSFGVVYKGIYHRTNETVALKIISLEEGESFDDL